MRPPVGAVVAILPEEPLYGQHGKVIERADTNYCVIVRWMQFGSQGRYCLAGFRKGDVLHGRHVFLSEHFFNK